MSSVVVIRRPACCGTVNVICKPTCCGTVSTSRNVADKALRTVSLPDFLSRQGEV